MKTSSRLVHVVLSVVLVACLGVIAQVLVVIHTSGLL